MTSELFWLGIVGLLLFAIGGAFARSVARSRVLGRPVVDDDFLKLVWATVFLLWVSRWVLS